MAQKKYSVPWNSTSQAPPATGFNLIGSTAVRPRLYEFDYGSTPVAPVDQASTFQILRTTGIGTAGSTPTPAPLDNQEVAAVCTAGINHSAEPTASTVLWALPLNHRASFRWIGNQDYEFIGAASSSNGISGRQSAATANYALTGVALFLE
jgi:hypothetical protein